MKIQVLGAHNTESRHFKYPGLIIDNILALDAGGLTSGLSFRDQMKIKAVLLTHAHYDHIRDIPALAMNLYLRKKSAAIYTHQAVYDNLIRYLLNGEIYPEFHKKPEEDPCLKMHILNPHEEIKIQDYTILPVPVIHALPAMGYQIASPDGKIIFYTGDTGPGLSTVWDRISPQLIFIELTASNRWEESMSSTGHLTPNLLHRELTLFRKLKGYLPQVICVHINPAGEKEIKLEILEVIGALGIPIHLAHEGMQVRI